jgi:hypothetical protein
MMTRLGWHPSPSLQLPWSLPAARVCTLQVRVAASRAVIGTELRIGSGQRAADWDWHGTSRRLTKRMISHG